MRPLWSSNEDKKGLVFCLVETAIILSSDSICIRIRFVRQFLILFLNNHIFPLSKHPNKIHPKSRSHTYVPQGPVLGPQMPLTIYKHSYKNAIQHCAKLHPSSFLLAPIKTRLIPSYTITISNL